MNVLNQLQIERYEQHDYDYFKQVKIITFRFPETK